MIYLVGISIAFFLSVLLLTKKKKTTADKILTCWLLLMGTHLLLFYLFFSGISYQHPFILGLDMPLPLLHGPLLFLYTASLTNQLPVKKKLLLLHFIPAVASWLYLIKFFVLPADQKVFIFQNKGVGFESFMLVHLAAIIISGVSYVIWSLLLLKRHRRSILDQFSDTEKINLQWLQYLIYGIGVIWIFVFVNDEMLFATVVLYIVFMGYFGIKQVGIFTAQASSGQVQPLPVHEKGTIHPVAYSIDSWTATRSSVGTPDLSTFDTLVQEPPGPAVIQDDTTEKKKYSKSGLTPGMAETLHSKLSTLMANEKLYTESELSLSELANRLNTLPNYLSQVINEKEGKTFYDYINTLRIQEFIRLIAIPENKKYTLLSLSYDCGFNSKSSFNKNFKKTMGMAPSQFKI